MKAQITFHPPRSSFAPRRSRWFLAALALLSTLPFAVRAQAQDGSYGQSPYGQQQYAPQPAQPAYGQPYPPQYAQPAYPQQYAQQPGYGEQYAQQPQYAQPDAGGQYAQPPYPQGQYPQQPYADQANADDPLAGPDAGLPDAGPNAAPPQSGQAMSPDQLEQLVAPIALYPDAMVAQVLAAATYPAQVASADQWLSSMGNAPADQIAAGANAQNWDPSVKALTAFPQVLAEMDRNLQWTTTLGNAYYNQPQDVLAAVQALRQRAQASGNLQNSPQEEMSYDQGNIELAPPDPNYVYVPVYNPWDVYGAPIAPYPGFYAYAPYGSLIGFGAVRFCAGLAMAAFLHSPFGWFGWGLDWFGHGILFNHAAWYSHSATVAHWGGGWHGGAGYGRGGYVGGRAYAANHFTQNYNRGYAQGGAYRQSYNRGMSQNFNRGYGSAYGNYGRQNYAYNSMPARPQQFASRPSAGSYGGQSFAGRSSSYYGGGQFASRGYASAPRTQAFAGRSYSMPSSRGFSGYGGAQRSYSAPRGFSGGGSRGFSGGGHGGGFGGGGHSAGGGGGHSFGGGGHGGGGGHHR